MLTNRPFNGGGDEREEVDLIQNLQELSLIIAEEIVWKFHSGTQIV